MSVTDNHIRGFDFKVIGNDQCWFFSSAALNGDLTNLLSVTG
jgi:hypothetical protein